MQQRSDVQVKGLRTLFPLAGQIGQVLRFLGSFTRRQPVGAVFGLILLLIAISAVAAPLIAPFPPLDAHFNDIRESPNGTYWLGTDELGRDFLSRLIYGTRISLMVAVLAVLLGDGVGLIWGTASGYLGGKFDIIGQRFLDLLMSFPVLILAMLLLLWLGAGVHTVIVAISHNPYSYIHPGNPLCSPRG